VKGERIGVPAAALYGGIAALVALLIAVGFLAGRASTAVPPVSPAPGAEAPSASLAAAAATPGLPPADPVLPDPAASVPEPADAPAAAAASQPAGPAGAEGAPDLRRQVTEYFGRMDAMQGAIKTWSDPSALAQEIMGQAMRGDSAGFDRLIAASAAARDGVSGLAVPAPCAEHHDLTLALLDDSVRILTQIRDGVASGDAGALAGLATTGSALEARARAVDELGASLRARYGIAK
jgi:hypothetical protein